MEQNCIKATKQALPSLIKTCAEKRLFPFKITLSQPQNKIMLAHVFWNV